MAFAVLSKSDASNGEITWRRVGNGCGYDAAPAWGRDDRGA
jgi:hypothetical protein